MSSNQEQLIDAAGKGDLAAVRLLLGQGANVNAQRDDRTPLFAAITELPLDKGDNIAIICLLLEQGANMEVSCDIGNAEMSPLYAAIQYNRTDVVRLLVERGLDIGKKRYSGHWIAEDNASVSAEDWTPLHAACTRGSQDMIRLLLDNGAKVEEKNERGWTPLHVACNHACDSNDVIEFLLDRGANIDAETDLGETPLDIAAGEGKTDVEDFLLSRMPGAHLFNASRDGNVALVRELIAEGASVTWNHARQDGDTPLHVSCSEGNLEVFKILLNHCDDIDAVKNEEGLTLVELACEMGERDVIEMVLDKGANIDAQDKEGNTPLHRECGSGMGVMKVLLSIF